MDSNLTRRDVLVAAGAVIVMDLAGCSTSRNSCTDTTGLTETEAQWRKSKGYIEPALEKGKSCVACAFFVAPTDSGLCGRCRLFKGPVHPLGSCFDFVPVGT